MTDDKNADANAVADLITAARDARGWNNVQLSEASGVAYSTLRGIVRPWRSARRRRPGREAVLAIADVLGIPEHDMLDALQRASGYAQPDADSVPKEPENASIRIFTTEFAKLTPEQQDVLGRQALALLRALRDDRN